ncbi:amidohydrolase [Candidatus Poribacteria bacterium]|nr:amidohydrolase [Candidatus Poribacteria bacterium]
MRIIDAHLHVWLTDLSKYPFNPRVAAPTLRADADFLIECMDDARIAGALIIQPIVYGFDHRYVTGTLKSHPNRFRGMCLIDPQHACPEDELARWRDEGYIAVRLNPNLFPPETPLDSPLGHRIFAEAGHLGMPVGFLINPDHFGAVDRLCEAHPETVAVIDHFGHCRPTLSDGEQFSHLLHLARHPNLHVKLSEFPRASFQEWPYADLHPWLPRLLEAYGAPRLMWATDFPFIVPQCGYTRGLTLMTDEAPGLDEETMHWLLAGTAEKVFGTWG